MFLYIFIKKYIKSKNQKHPQKMANQDFRKTTFPTFGPLMRTFMRTCKPLHNGLHVTTS